MAAIEKVGVVGGGLMGSGIAEVTAKAGLDTVVVEIGHFQRHAGQTAACDGRTCLRAAEPRFRGRIFIPSKGPGSSIGLDRHACAAAIEFASLNYSPQLRVLFPLRGQGEPVA